MSAAHDRIYNRKRPGKLTPAADELPRLFLTLFAGFEADTADNDNDDDDEVDEEEQRLEASGCKEEHFAVLDCMGDNGRDWRRCQDVAKALKECMAKQTDAK